MTPAAVIKKALTKLRVVDPGQALNATDLSTGLEGLNIILKRASANRLMQFYIRDVAYPIGINQSYSVGPGLTDFPDNVRPTFIQTVRKVLGNGFEVDLNLLTKPQWDAVRNKAATSPDGPDDFYYDGNAPVGRFYLAPKLTGGTMVLRFSQWNPLRLFAANETAVEILDYYPEEYEPWMVDELAEYMNPDYNLIGANELAEIIRGAATSKAAIMMLNNDRLSGAFGATRTGVIPTKGDGQPVGQ